jgi:hypothetical protein
LGWSRYEAVCLSRSQFFLSTILDDFAGWEPVGYSRITGLGCLVVGWKRKPYSYPGDTGKRGITMKKERMPFISDGIDVGADFSELSIALPNYELEGKPYKLIYSKPKSLQEAVERIRF